MLVADRPDPRQPRRDADADRDPRTASVRVAGRAQDGRGGVDGGRRVARARHQREEERHDLVADELVDTTVVVEHGLRSGREEPIDQGAELVDRHALRERRRAADVREEVTAVDLRTAVMLLHEIEARVADGRVLEGRPLADGTHQRRGGPGERGSAELAPRAVGQVAQDAAGARFHGIAAGQELVPERLIVAGRSVARSHRTTSLLPRSSGDVSLRPSRAGGPACRSRRPACRAPGGGGRRCR